MTIIAAAVGPDGTWIGSDGLSVNNGSRITCRSMPKWNVSPGGEWAFAGAGDVTFDAVIKVSWSTLWSSVEIAGRPTADEKDDDPEERLSGLIDAMRSAIDEAPGVELVRDDGCIFGDYRFSPLVATAGHVWRLNSDLMGVDPALEGVYQAAGAGIDYAIGAMSALLARGETSAELLVRTAVETACRVSILCGGEVFVHRLGACQEGAPC